MIESDPLFIGTDAWDKALGGGRIGLGGPEAIGVVGLTILVPPHFTHLVLASAVDESMLPLLRPLLRG